MTLTDLFKYANNNVKLKLAGDGTDKNDIEKKIKDLAKNHPHLVKFKKELSTIFDAFKDGGVVNGIKAIGTAIKSAFASNYILLGITAAIAAIYAVFKAFDKFVFDYDEKLEKLQESVSKYQETVNELENVESELKSIGERIDELNAKTSLSLIEQDELDKLIASENSLKVQKEYLESMKKIDAEDVKQKFNEYWENESPYINGRVAKPDVEGNDNPIRTNPIYHIASNIGGDNNVGVPNHIGLEKLFHEMSRTSGTVLDSLTRYQAIISNLENKKTELYSSENYNDKDFKKLEEDIQTYKKYVQKIYDEIYENSNGFDEFYFEPGQYLEFKNVYDDWLKITNSAGHDTQSKLNGFFKLNDIENYDLKYNLQEYVKTLDSFSDFNLDSLDFLGIDELKEFLSESKIKYEDFFAYLKALDWDNEYNLPEVSIQLKTSLNENGKDSVSEVEDFIEKLSDEELNAVANIKYNLDVDTSKWDIKTWEKEIANYLSQNELSFETILKNFNTSIDDIQSVYSNLSNAMNEYSENGAFSIDTLQQLLELKPEYLGMLVNENGQIELNKNAIKEMTKAQLEDAKSKLYQSAISEINAVASRKAGDEAVDSAENRKKSTDEINKETEAIKKNTAADMLNAAAKKKAEYGVSEQEVNEIVEKYTNLAKMIDQSLANIDVNPDGVINGFNNTAESIKKTQEELDELAKSKALTELKYKFDVIDSTINKISTSISLLDNMSELTYENDFISKIDILSRQIELTQNKTKLLSEEFNILKNEEYDNADSAQELANRMETVATSLMESKKQAIEYATTISSYYMLALTSISSLSSESISKINNLLNRNIKTLSEGGLQGIEFNLTPNLPKSALEKQAQENKQIEAEMSSHYETLNELKRNALDLEYQEQLNAYAQQEQDLLETLNKFQTKYNEYQSSLIESQQNTNEIIYENQQNNNNLLLQQVDTFILDIKNSWNEVANWFSLHPLKLNIENPDSAITNATSIIDSNFNSQNNRKTQDVPNSLQNYDNSVQTGVKLANTARNYLGVDYVYGGSDPSGFDCSGLMQYVFNLNGIKLNRTAAEQFKQGLAISSMQTLTPGDLVFFGENGKASHVGMFIGNGKMIHAPTTNDVVKEETILGNKYWTSKFLGGRRMFAEGTKDYGIAGENYKKEYAINKKTGEWHMINSPTLFDTKEYDIVGEKVSEKIDNKIPVFATGTPIKDPNVLNMIKYASDETGVPINYLLSIIDQESGNKWVGKVKDGSGYSYGYMQLYSGGALTTLSEDRKYAAMTDPATNILEGAKYLKGIYDRLGNNSWADAASAYNQGEGNFHKYGRNSYGNEVYNRANSSEFLKVAEELNGISKEVSSISNDTKTISKKSFHSELKSIFSNDEQNSTSNEMTNYESEFIDFIKSTVNEADKLNNDTYANFEKLQNYNNEMKKTLSSSLSSLEENRWSSDYASQREKLTTETSNYLGELIGQQVEVNLVDLFKKFNLLNKSYNAGYEYYKSRKESGANADELSVIIEGLVNLEELKQNASDEYVNAISEETEFRKELLTNEMQSFDDKISWQDKFSKNIEKQLQMTKSLDQQAELRKDLLDVEVNKIETNKQRQSIAHSKANELRADERYSSIFSKFDTESWFDADGNTSSQFHADVSLMVETNPELVPFMNQLCELLGQLKQEYYKAEEAILSSQENITSQIKDNFDKLIEPITQKIDESQWLVDMMSDDNYSGKLKENNNQISLHINLLNKTISTQEDLNKRYEKGEITYQHFVDLSNELNSNFQNNLSNLKNLFDEINQLQLDSIENKIEDIEESSSKITDELQKQVEKLEEEQELLNEELEKWNNVLSAVKKVVDDQIDVLNDEKDSANEYWDTQIEAARKLNNETERTISLLKAKSEVEKAESQHTALIYKNGKFTYMANQSDVDDARQNYADTYREISQEKAIELLEESRDLEIKSYEDRIEALQKYLDKLNEVSEKYTEDVNDMAALEELGVHYKEEAINQNLELLNKLSDGYYKTESQIEGNIQKRIDKLNKEIKAQEKATEKTVENLNKQKDVINDTSKVYNDFYNQLVKMWNNGEKDSIPALIENFVNNLPSVLNNADFSILIDKLKSDLNINSNNSSSNNVNNNISSDNSSDNFNNGSTNNNSSSNKQPIINDDTIISNDNKEKAINALKQWQSESLNSRKYSISIFNSPQEAWDNLSHNLNESIGKMGYIQKVGNTYYAKYLQYGDPGHAQTIATFRAYAKGTDNARKGLAFVGEKGTELVDFRGGESVIDASRVDDFMKNIKQISSLDNPLYKFINDKNIKLDTHTLDISKMMSDKFNSFYKDISSNQVTNNNVTFGDINFYEVDNLEKALAHANNMMSNLAIQIRHSK